MKFSDAGSLLAMIGLGIALAALMLFPQARGAGGTGGPGDPVVWFRAQDPWLPYPADTRQTVLALARRADDG
ncbi:MAG TPA: hypothetical protein PKE47_03170, partial [Verrucomicrobiota bacterium]|nr:hypothetical protein [Verrucomicrobiota bacterium]